MNQRRRGVILGYANIIIKNAVNLLYTPMLLSFVGRGDYGVFQTANSFVFSLTLLSFGFSGAYMRFYAQRKASDDEGGIRVLNGMYLTLYVLIDAVAISLGLLGAASVGTVFSASFTPDEVALAGTLMRIMTINVAITLLSTVFDAYVMVHEEFTFQQSRQMLTTLATPGLALALLSAGMGAVGISVAQLSVNLVLLTLNARFAIHRLGMRFDVGHPDFGLFGSVAAFSAWIFANQVCELINQNVPNVILGAVCGASVVAIFAISLQIRSVFYSLSTTMSSVFVPMVNRIVAESDDNSELTKVMSRVGRYQALLYCWVYGGFVVLGRWFIRTWANPSFSDAYLLVIAMTGPLFIPLVQNVGIEIQKAKNMHKARSLAYLCFAIVNLALTWFLSPHIGCWAPVVGFDAYVILGCGIFMNWYYQRCVGLDMVYFWRRVSPVVGACAVSASTCLLGTTWYPVGNIVQFLLWGAAYTALYVAFVWLVVLDEVERDSVVMRMRNIGLRGEER